MEEWNDGRVEEWKNSTIRQFDNSTMEEWKMWKFDNLTIRQSKNGMMEGWKGGNKEYAFFLCFFSICVIVDNYFWSI